MNNDKLDELILDYSRSKLSINKIGDFIDLLIEKKNELEIDLAQALIDRDEFKAKGTELAQDIGSVLGFSAGD